MEFTSDTGRAAGVLSGESRRETAAHTVGEALEYLGPLDDSNDAQRWLERLVLWGASGRLTGIMVSSCVRGVDIWRRIREAETSFEEIEALRASVRELGAERDRLERENEQLRLERRSA